MKLPSYSDFNYLQKVNAKCPQIPDEKTKFCSVDKNFLSFFLKHQKLFVKEAKLFFFIRNLRAFCIYFLQVLKIRIWGHLLFAGIAFKIYLLMPSNFDEKIPFDYDWFCPLKTMAFINLKALPSANTFHCFLREKTVYFSDEVFSLRFRGYFKQQCTVKFIYSEKAKKYYEISRWLTLLSK